MVFHIDIVFLYDIDGFSLRYRISKGHQWFFPIDIVFLCDINGLSDRYRVFL